MRNSNTAWNKIISSPLTLILALVLLVFLARAVYNVRKSADVAATKLDQAQSEFNRLQTQKADLSNKVDYLSTPQGVETELRTKYRAVKEGESVAVIVGAEESTSSVATTTPELGWWGKISRFFGF